MYDGFAKCFCHLHDAALSVFVRKLVLLCLWENRAEAVHLQLFGWFVYLSFSVDGRPAPPLKGQVRRQKQREDFAVSFLTDCVLVFFFQK